MVMECTERLSAPSIKVCQYDKIKCTSPCVNGARFCTKHLNPSSHQCSHIRGGNQCKNRIAGSEQRTLCSTHIAVKASRKRRRTEAPAHKDLVNKTPPLALHVFRIMTQERQRLKFKPNIYKRPLEHMKWVMKRERLAKNPTYPSGMESDCDEHDSPHDYVTLEDPIPIDTEKMGDVRHRSVYLAQVEQRLHTRLDSLMHQVNSYKRTQVHFPSNTKAVAEAARSSTIKTTKLLQGGDTTSDADLCPCSLPNPASKYSCCVCNGRALPFTKYCVTHILRDNKQLLFGNCKTIMSEGVTCSAPTVTVARNSCNLHSLLKRFGVTKSQDIETESSSSESETEDAVLEPYINSTPSSPRIISKKRISSPLPPHENHLNHHVEMPELDMLPMQPDTILESSMLPEEPDIPLSVRFLEPTPHPPPNKRVRNKDEEMQARAMAQYMKYPMGPQSGYYYSPYGPQNYGPGPNAPVHFLQGYNKEGEPIYGYHENKQHEYQKFFARQHSTSGSDSGSRPSTPVMSAEMMHFYQQQQQQRFMHPGTPSPIPPSTPEQSKEPSPNPKKKGGKKKKEPQQPVDTECTPPKSEQKVVQTYGTPPNQVTNPYTQKNGAGSPNSAASPSTMALLKSKLADVKKEEEKKEETAKTPAKRKAPPKNTPPKNAPNSFEHPVAMVQQQGQQPGQQQQHPVMVNRPVHMQPNYYQYQHPGMYPGSQHPHNQYYLQMYMTQQQQQMHPLIAQQGQQPPQPPNQDQSNGPISKEAAAVKSETTTTQMPGHSSVAATGPELNEYQKYALQQQRQRQMMIAQSQMAGAAGPQYGYPQHYQYYQHPQQFPAPSPNSSPKTEKKKKKPPAKEKKEETKPAPPKKKPSLSSPSPKDAQLSSLQSLMSTASSGWPLDALPDEQASPAAPRPPSKPPARTKKASAKHDGNGELKHEMKSPPPVPHPNYAYYQGYNAIQVMQMAPMKTGYVNGSGPLYFRMEDGEGMVGHTDNKPVVINDAVLARNRPSSVLMKNPGWVERYMSRKPDDKLRGAGGNKSKTASPRRSPQKSHRNLIFHNTEIGTISDKLAKQQKNAEQRSSHRAMCAKSKQHEQVVPQQNPLVPDTHTFSTPDQSFHLPDSSKPPKTDPNTPLQLNSQPDGVT